MNLLKHYVAAIGGKRVIFKRAAAKLRAQDWTAIAIEVGIVFIGVFAGNQVSTWNQARLQKHETEQLLSQLAPELKKKIVFFESVKTYYGTTGQYAGQALRGWDGDPGVSNDQFVIAAYQASQIYGIAINTQSWSLTFGGDQLRNIDDATLRGHLSQVLTRDYDSVAGTAVSTAYRDDVRKVIPNAVQARIRTSCGDRHMSNRGVQNLYVLPATCSLTFDPAEAARTAAALRAHQELPGELNLHLARVASYLEDTDGAEQPMRQLENDLDGRGEGKLQ